VSAAASRRDLRLLVAGRFTSLLGSEMVPVALAFAVLEATGSPARLGLVMTARVVPMVALTLLGGVWADRVAPQRLMIGADALAILAQGTTAALLFTGHAELAALVLLQALGGVASAFFRPAASALPPLVVPRDDLQRANAILRGTAEAASIAGPVLGGLLFAAAGAGWAFAIDAATYVASIVTLAMLRPAARETATTGRHVRRELGEGWRAVRSRTWLLLSIAAGLSFQLLVLPPVFVLGPALAQDRLGGARAWGLLAGSIGVGALIGAWLTTLGRPARPLVVGVATGYLAVVSLLALPRSTSMLVLLPLVALLGVSMSVFDTLFETAVQEHVPGELLGRVFALDWFGSSMLRPLGLAAIGPLAAALGVTRTITVCAVLLTVTVTAVLATSAIRAFR
jgi:MFS family permease